MKNRIFLMLLIVSLFVLNLQLVVAEERPIYVGDIIELNIDSQEYTRSEIEVAFEAFEIVDIIEGDGNYELKIRSFEVGEHTVSLGNTEIIITVASLLNESDNELIEANVDLEESGPIIPWTLIKYISLTVGILGLITMIVILIKEKPKKPLTGYELFIHDIEQLDKDSKDYIYLLSKSFKVYLSNKLDLNLRGLSTKEMSLKLYEIETFKLYCERVISWFATCDILKYSNDKGEIDTRLKLKDELLVMLKIIEDEFELSIKEDKDADSEADESVDTDTVTDTDTDSNIDINVDTDTDIDSEVLK